MIPESKQAAVARALGHVFGRAEADEVSTLAAGLSTALVLRVVVNGRPYLLRLIMPGAPVGGHAARQFACMKAASDAGIAPRILYASVEDEVLLTEFVDRKPYPADAGVRIARTIRRLHALDGFPDVMNYLDRMDGLVQRLRAAEILQDSVARDFFRGYAEASSVYPQRSEMVACHNDLKSDNILFDGATIWLVDWEAAFLNDRYADLAWASTFLVYDEAAEDAYLRAYFDEPVSEYARSRFYLMRVLMHVFAAALLLPMAAKAGLAIGPDVEVPTFREFHRRWIAREITMVGMDDRRDYGLVHCREALREMGSERFRDSISTVRRHCV